MSVSSESASDHSSDLATQLAEIAQWEQEFLEEQRGDLAVEVGDSAFLDLESVEYVLAEGEKWLIKRHFLTLVQREDIVELILSFLK